MQNNVVLVVDSSRYGGIESHIFHLANLLQQKKVPVLVLFTANYGAHVMDGMLDKANIPRKRLNGTFQALKSFIKNSSLHTVFHAHGYKASISTRLACLLSDRSCITTFHCGDRGTGKQAFYCWLDKFTSGLSSNIAVSAEIAEWHGGNIRTLDNFISPLLTDNLAQQSVKQDVTKIAFVGRLSEEKGPDLFMQVAVYFAAHTNIAFHVYGDGPMRPELEVQNTGNVTFHGFCENMASKWQNIDALFITSRNEGMPMVAIEAMMHGVSVIAAPRGELPTLVGNGERGWLAKSGSMNSLLLTLADWLASSDTDRNTVNQLAQDYVLEHCSGAKQWEIYSLLYGLEARV